MSAPPLALVLRADASHALGAGHVMRLLALADGARARGGHARFVIGGDPAPYVAAMQARGHDAVAAREPLVDDVLVHADALDAAIVLDMRAVTPAEVAALARRPLAALDDLTGAPPPAPIIVNPALGAEAWADRYAASAVRLLGRRFALLRADVRRCAPRPPGAALDRVLITFGGSDPAGATPRALAALAQIAPAPLELIVVVGGQFADHDRLARAAAGATRRGHRVDVRVDVADLPALMRTADAAISGAGGTLAELGYLGVPTACFAVAPDQRQVARAHADAELVAAGESLVGDGALDDDQLRARLRAFVADDAGRIARAARAAALIDGAGAERVLDAIAARR